MDIEASPGLPPGVDLLWGRRERGRRGPRPGLSLARIVTAAVEIADEEGLGPLSMSRLAQRLGFTAMSLYRYLGGKDELLMLMFDAVLDSPPPGPAAGEGWRPVLERWAGASRAVHQRHPWALDVPISGPPLGPNQLRWLDVGLAAFTDTRAAPEEKLSALLLLDGYVRAEARLWVQLRHAYGPGPAAAAAPAGAGPPPSWGAVLRQLIDGERYPALMEIVGSGALDSRPDYDDTDFEFGLARILDGLEAFLRPPGH
ncbi:TetR/AcrR family transcriptional regulator [Parafrankia discariae]|uniref:TetR/AcrR family transcriptional regulator n=1 Tax=Parafrankia discariae TaxID=365528 RepID=UPI00035C93A9|nr:TetR/AcrR family transcriptional regulator [Parafrankia discariae]